MVVDVRTLREIGIEDIADLAEQDVLKYPNNLQLLFYSCKLYEMKKEKADVKRLEEFISNENENYGSYYECIKNAEKWGGRDCEYPKEISMECTTVCNAKCRNCTHETLIQSGDRKLDQIKLEDAYYRIKKLRLLSLLFAKEEPRFMPVGLGEPLCHPYIIDIVRYAKNFFPKIQVTTNGRLLNREITNALLELDLEEIQVSLSYYDAEIYRREIGMDQVHTFENLKRLFMLRNERQSKTRIDTFVFDNIYNTINDRRAFLEQFDEMKKSGDFVVIRQYERLVDNELEGSNPIRLRGNYSPCHQLWSELMVDVEGHLFPCCLGVWKKYDSFLSIGNIFDDPMYIMGKIDDIRNNHKKGFFGSCERCHILQTLAVESDEGRRYADLEMFCKKFKRIHLYGAGTVGRRIKKVLKNGGIQVTDYIVTDLEGKTEYESLPLTSIKQIDFDDEDGFVVCIREAFSEELVKNLTEIGVTKESIFVQKLFYPKDGLAGEVINRELQ